MSTLTETLYTNGVRRKAQNQGSMQGQTKDVTGTQAVMETEDVTPETDAKVATPVTPVAPVAPVTPVTPVTPATPVTPTTPAVTETQTETEELVAPRWTDVTKAIDAKKKEYDEAKARLEKNKKRAKMISAIGDFATQALQLWGATQGVEPTVKTAALTDATEARYKTNLEEHEKKLKEFKTKTHDDYKAKWEEYKNRKDLALKEEEAERKALRDENTAAYNEARLKLAEAKEKRLTEKDPEKQKKLDAEIKLLEARARYYASGGSRSARSGNSNKKRTWTVDGKTYDSITGAYVALPKQYRDWVDKTIYNSLHAMDKRQVMEEAVEMYLQGVEVPVSEESEDWSQYES